MMTRANSARIAEGLTQFRVTRVLTLTMVEGINQTQLSYATSRNHWSIGEILDHMLLGERINRGQITKLIEISRSGRRPELNLTLSDLNISIAGVPRSVLPLFEAPMTLMNRFVPDELRNYLTRNRLIPFRNPDPATPRRGRPASELRSDLIASLGETERLFQDNPDIDYGEMRVRHPLLGTYDVPGLIRFMSAHEERHQSQIESVLRSPGFRTQLEL